MLSSSSQPSSLPVTLNREAAPAITEQEPVRGHVEDGCPMAGFLETLTRPWTMHILWTLRTHGPMRFGALRRSIKGISARLLTVRLRGLEAEGFVRRSVLGGKLPEVTYSPTERLTDMDQVMQHLEELHRKWENEVQGASAAERFA